jgi:ribosome-associated translation inhibitor RaiA
MSLLPSIIASAGVGGAVAAAIVWLGKTWISTRIEAATRHDFAVKLEQVRADMSRQHAVAIEQFKSDCRRDLEQRIIKFERLHERAADAIEGIYARLHGFLRAVQDYVTLFQGPEVQEQKNENARRVVQAKTDLLEYYTAKRIYLSEGTTTKIDEFIDTVFEMAFDFRLRVVERMGRGDDIEKWTEIDRFMNERAPVNTGRGAAGYVGT